MSVQVKPQKPRKLGKEGEVTHGFFKEMRVNKWLYVMLLPGVLYIFIWGYLPLVGISIAFTDYHPIHGIMSIFRGYFVGMDNFRFFFLTNHWINVTRNTLWLNTLFIVFRMGISIMLAIMICEIGQKLFKRTTQSLMILPHFISWPIVGLFMTMFLLPNGIVNQVISFLGFEAINFQRNPDPWPTILTTMTVWKASGFGTIIFIATITGIDPALYEAAAIDGANRFQCIRRITIPLIKNTTFLLLIFAVGNIFQANFGMIWAMVGDNFWLLPTTDVIDTYVFRMLRQLNNMGMSSAVGLFQNVMGFIMVIIANSLARKFNPESAVF
jgi:putative aldouronate transport system permease protein